MIIKEAKRFVLAGKSIFTLYSKKLDKRYTYKITQDKKNKERYFCKVLFGPDNTNDYRYIGLFYKDNLSLRTSSAAHIPHTAPQFVMLQYFLAILNGDYPWPETCEYYPSNRCGKCGRLLTTPESIQRGIGPECWARM
jgi:hypothetical protein